MILKKTTQIGHPGIDFLNRGTADTLEWILWFLRAVRWNEGNRVASLATKHWIPGAPSPQLQQPKTSQNMGSRPHEEPLPWIMLGNQLATFENW